MKTATKFQAMTKRLACVLTLVVMLGLGANTALAQTLFTYNGSGIWTKASVNTAYVNGSTCSVNHRQTRNNKGVDRYLTVYVQRQDGLSWDDVASRTYSNEGSGTFSTYCPAGTYRLYFYSGSAYSKFDISGSFYR